MRAKRARTETHSDSAVAWAANRQRATGISKARQRVRVEAPGLSSSLPPATRPPLPARSLVSLSSPGFEPSLGHANKITPIITTTTNQPERSRDSGGLKLRRETNSSTSSKLATDSILLRPRWNLAQRSQASLPTPGLIVFQLSYSNSNCQTQASHSASRGVSVVGK